MKTGDYVRICSLPQSTKDLVNGFIRYHQMVHSIEDFPSDVVMVILLFSSHNFERWDIKTLPDDITVSGNSFRIIKHHHGINYRNTSVGIKRCVYGNIYAWHLFLREKRSGAILIGVAQCTNIQPNKFIGTTPGVKYYLIFNRGQQIKCNKLKLILNLRDGLLSTKINGKTTIMHKNIDTHLVYNLFVCIKRRGDAVTIKEFTINDAL